MYDAISVKLLRLEFFGNKSFTFKQKFFLTLNSNEKNGVALLKILLVTKEFLRKRHYSIPPLLGTTPTTPNSIRETFRGTLSCVFSGTFGSVHQ